MIYKKIWLFIFLSVLVVCSCKDLKKKYSPDWDSLDSRPLPVWYDEAKIGVFMHWGPYSVPGVGSEWFWYNWYRNESTTTQYMEKFYPPGFKYQEFGPMFKAEFFNATQWAELVERSGAKYFVFTSKHHDGFQNWDSEFNFGWNSRDIGPKRDIVGELATAFKTVDVSFGLYHSLFEWFHPMWLADKAANFTTQNFVNNKVWPEMVELINKYEPQVLWSDGEWEAPYEYWKSTEFIAWLYDDSPVKDSIVTNDRWGSGNIICHHGDFYTCSDRYNPGVLQPHKWENAMTIDKYSWGFRRNMNIEDILSMEELIGQLAMTVSCGGNLLMNVGPTSQGTIPTIFQERLTQMGDWLAVNGEAVYGSSPWKHQNDTVNGNVWYTTKVDKNVGVVVYGFVLEWPEDGFVRIGAIAGDECKDISLLGFSGVINHMNTEQGMILELPDRDRVPSDWAWVFRFASCRYVSNEVWRRG
jgi:alpha-L-fucosidase